MDKNKYLDDIKDIKDIMDRSTKFISLSGLSGISAGIVSLAAAYYAFTIGYKVDGNHDFTTIYDSAWGTMTPQLTILAISTIILSLIFGVFFTYKNSKNKNQNMWNSQAIRLYVNLAIPLFTGGVLCLILMMNGFFGLMAPLTLIFYGLALVNASKYTLSEIRSLGLMEIALGLLSTCLIGYALVFWAIGFGVLHIIYGIIMKNKYEA